MTEQERFDREIEALCGAMPPRRDLLTVRPWGRAFTWILWGLVLQTVHLGLLGLEFLLPLLGVFLQLPGFRQLRNSGRWFRRCWQLAIVQGIWAAVFVAAVEVTGLALALLAHPPLGYLIASVVGIFKVAQTVFLHLGLREIWRELGQEHPSPVLYLMWFQGLGPAIKLVDALWPGAEQVLFWPWLVLFFLAVRRLWQGARELDQWGYALRPAPVRLPAWGLVGACFFGVLLLSLGTGYLAQQGTMDYAPAALAEDAPPEAVPQWVWEMLPAEERQLMAASEIFCDTEVLPRHSGWESAVLRINTGERSARIIAAVRQPDQAVLARQGAMMIQPYPISRNDREDIREEAWNNLGEIRGAAFFTRGGSTRTAPLQGKVRLYASGGLFDRGPERYIQVDWAYPLGAKNCRSYVAFDVILDSEPLMDMKVVRRVVFQGRPLLLPGGATTRLLALGKTDGLVGEYFPIAFFAG